MYHSFRILLEFPFLYARGLKIYFKNNIPYPHFTVKKYHMNVEILKCL